MYLVTGDDWCPLPDLHLPDHGSGLLAVSLGRKILVCGFPTTTSSQQHPNILASSPVLGQEGGNLSVAKLKEAELGGEEDRACFIADNLSTAGSSGWQRLADRIFPSGLSSWVLMGSKVIASAGLNYEKEGNPFESFDLDAENGSWSVEEFSLPNVPNDLHIYGSCMVAIDEHRILVAGGASLENGAITGGELVQVFDTRTAAWERLDNMDPPRLLHACMLHQGGVLVTGGKVAGGPGGSLVDFAGTQLLNFNSGRWQQLGDMNQPRSEHILVQVEGVPTVIGGESASFSEQLLNGSWQQHVIHTPAVMIASVMVDPLDFHC